MQSTLTRCVRLIAITITVLAAGSRVARADAIVVTRAMKASTIAEIFVEPTEIRVKMEIGGKDVLAFAGTRSETEFLATRWSILVDGQPLKAVAANITPAKRIARDEVTGDPLAEQPADAPDVVRIDLKFTFEGKPNTLTIRPPHDTDGRVAANIGFVCYHNSLPVNDFRYLPSEVTLDLDWRDPWYSRFRHPNLRRQFDAPLSAFLYVEPYEVRQEIILRPKDLRAWLDLDLDEAGVIPVDRQETLKKRIAEFLSHKNPVTINGQPAEGRLDRIHFIRRSLRGTGVIEPPVDLDVTSATLGIIFVYPIDELPQQVSMTWELFGPKIQTVPAIATDEAGGLPARLTPDDPVLTWRNYLKNPTIPQMAKIDAPSSRREFSVPVISIICGVIAIIASVTLLRQRAVNNRISGPALGVCITTVLGGLLALPFANVVVADPLTPQSTLSDDDAREIVAGLLTNTYRAFDHHDESLIYDRLSRSIDGELLSQVYLETRRSMEVKNQGGLRISVKEVTIGELAPLVKVTDAAARSFRVRWRVAGSIGHWGHIHRRENEHVAELTIAPRDKRWKITSIEMLDEQPIDSTQPTKDSN